MRGKAHREGVSCRARVVVLDDTRHKQTDVDAKTTHRHSRHHHHIDRSRRRKTRRTPASCGSSKARGRPGVCRGSQCRRLRWLRRGWRPVAWSAMTPLGSPGRCGVESIPRDDVLFFLVSPVVTLLQCNTKDGDAIQDNRGRSVVHAHGTSRAHPRASLRIPHQPALVFQRP